MSSIILTKEQFAEMALKQQTQQAAQYGMTIEEWREAVISGSLITGSLWKNI